MTVLTETGQLGIGYRDENGVWHKEFELRLPTMGDVEDAMAEAGPDASQARVNRYVWARTLTRLGSLPSEAITPDLLRDLPDTEYGRFQDAEDRLRKKLMASSATAGN